MCVHVFVRCACVCECAQNCLFIRIYETRYTLLPDILYTTSIHSIHDCCFEPYFIMPGITNKNEREKTTLAKENDVERRKMKKNAHPERIFIKLFITFRKTKSYHVLRINDTLSLHRHIPNP